MAAARFLQRQQQPRGRILGLEQEATGLVDRMPELLMEADHIASTVAHGIHGRRRAGTGETFWQFRQFEQSDPAQLIDWRRSASSDALYIREREWEAAHTIHLWPDISPSMNFRSHLAPISKRDRALVLMLAAAELLVRGGERVALLAMTRPSASRKAATHIAETIATHAETTTVKKSRPPRTQLSRYSGLILFSDFLAPIEATRERIEVLAATGTVGHMVQVLDPAEETLPYAGRTEFYGASGRERWVADRVEALRPKYKARFAAHRDAVADLARRFGWSFMCHHTDRPASEALLSLMMHLDGSHGSYRWTGPGAKAAETQTEAGG